MKYENFECNLRKISEILLSCADRKCKIMKLVIHFIKITKNNQKSTLGLQQANIFTSKNVRFNYRMRNLS